jgi:hypothetical protein
LGIQSIITFPLFSLPSSLPLFLSSILFSFFFLLFLFFFSMRDWTLDVEPARQALYDWTAPPPLFLLSASRWIESTSTQPICSSIYYQNEHSHPVHI